MEETMIWINGHLPDIVAKSTVMEDIDIVHMTVHISDEEFPITQTWGEHNFTNSLHPFLSNKATGKTIRMRINSRKFHVTLLVL